MTRHFLLLRRFFVLAILPFACFDGAASPLSAQGGGGFFGSSPPKENLFSQIRLSSEGVLVAADGTRKSVRLWDAQTGQLRLKLGETLAGVDALDVSADGKVLAISDGEKAIRLYDAPTGQLVRTLRGHASSPSRLKFSPDGKILVSGSDGHESGKEERGRAELLVWDREAGQLLHRLPQSKGLVTDLAFLPDGETLLASFFTSLGEENAPDGVQIWTLKSGERMATLKFEPFKARSLAVSPDGKLMAYGSEGIILLWDIPTRTLLRALTGPGDGLVTKLAFSPDGRSIASTASRVNSGAYIVRSWEVATWHGLWQRDFQRNVLALEFSRDGSTLMVADYESVMLYDFESTTTRREWFPRGDALKKTTQD